MAQQGTSWGCCCCCSPLYSLYPRATPAPWSCWRPLSSAGWAFVPRCSPLPTGRSYWFAARKSLLVEIVSTMLVCSRSRAVVIVPGEPLVPIRHGLAGPFFGRCTCSRRFAGALVVYPLLSVDGASRPPEFGRARRRTDSRSTLPSLQQLSLECDRRQSNRKDERRTCP